jgi:pyridoxine 5-phosphate synthase
MPVRLHVNVDHVATVRNARGTAYPDPVLAAKLCEAAGADGITAHLREDRRHIRDEDIERLRASLDTPLNLEMAATDEMIRIAERVLPRIVTLVPERREERTTEGGLSVRGDTGAVREAIAMADQCGIKPSLFIAPDLADVEASRELGAAQIELHTGELAHRFGSPAAEAELERIRRAAARGVELGLEVAAGHGLTRHNTVSVAAVPGIVELNTGHAIIADAVLVGLDRAVRDYRAAIDRGVRLRPS